MEALSKKFLRRKLAGHPFLWLLLQDAWFRLGFIAFFSLLLFLGLFLPRIWRTSPPGFRPVIKVSGLDLAQAWSLKRSALKAAAAGRFEEAHYAWMAALANNRADPELVRGSLRCAVQSDDQRRYRRFAVAQVFWLLQLTGTNRNDLELAAKVLGQHQRSDLVISLLEPRQQDLTPALEAAYLKALFQADRIPAFTNRWARVQANLPSDEELLLYRLACDAGGAPTAAAHDAVKTLLAAVEKPALRILACRLLLTASARRLDAEQAGELLGRLNDWQEDTLPDHLGYWRLLSRVGRKEEALRLAESRARRPASAEEALELAQLFRAWTLPDRALEVFRQFGRDFRDSAELWIAYSRALLEGRRWDELRRVAFEIRVQSEAGQEGLAAYSYYLEGRAELGLRRRFHATSAFQKMSEWEFHFPLLGLSVANDLIGLDFAASARDVLTKLEKSLAANAEYWSALFQAGERLKQTDLMLAAARRAHELRPADPSMANNYAAALLIQREAPEEAIRLTLRAIWRSPHFPTARINHAAALLLNERAEEALAFLNDIDLLKLTETQRTIYHLDRFEACLKLQRYAEAWANCELIDPRHLYPPQARWLEQARAQLPARDRNELTLLSRTDGG